MLAGTFIVTLPRLPEAVLPVVTPRRVIGAGVGVGPADVGVLVGVAAVVVAVGAGVPAGVGLAVGVNVALAVGVGVPLGVALAVGVAPVLAGSSATRAPMLAPAVAAVADLLQLRRNCSTRRSDISTPMPPLDACKLQRCVIPLGPVTAELIGNREQADQTVRVVALMAPSPLPP